ncbi:bifunctional 4-hydroxy-2-oxoglutarate aldolase/2-dehydro-3-deoxy-phosphogluconate aldolase [Clostridium botulinum C]|uniref:Bifunctional 4-hydroxy-2-oxoglutarate aldolase/2-dehydro-3-deoxy-phosphogluconate aldolase n=2 Tax=Clostridium botulinum TaxID=1491 RepID=A0A9Q4XVP1_CLOBO|nr:MULTISPECIES: bifunctional 4-hydroxy-2-oxoglutarate aldolase/2-dehydro-3-deoxy-phosphogluconate aldolase [Clostridium]AYF53370.1 bifunctional 2-keto-4-hydroxyglutarate aldolase/2-keto-3-deoxy-6-phosphogluconate aldolase [Clostridium novyi]MCD3193763.1 bifunctional 4-hydroxy-2-oxoglutarate aldolase/2-dehydro-3-deoxy-phosphogluconate aldolase [Clostridium botulinum C]MCD3199831.1 bifunctional 4-hydroxy-2-oxoglutarate aldolase/2-dehydro-3-deoxy-phosphogluconate aldolase [Clostridium botulinum C]
MIKKIDILERIVDIGVVAVIRANSKKEAIKISESCIEGGIPAIEVTFTVKDADKVIRELKDKFPSNKLIVGAGTVLDSETARVAILNGAEYIVSPSFDLETAKLCNRYQIPYMAGCMTITEIIRAMEAGVDIVKLFPGSAYGPSIIKAIKDPIPQVSIMPTGGVSLDNVKEWIKNGCVAVGVGGSLTSGAKTGNYKLITETAKKFVEEVKQARN